MYKNGFFKKENKPYFVYSGEIHYFRIPADQWKDRLMKAKNAGLNTVASYIPWGLHEAQEGKFDFTGKSFPELDVLSFIRLTQECGIDFIPRIGPMSQGEMINEGLPAWLLSDYPEAFNRPRGGHVLHHQGTPAYLTETFQKKVMSWYDQILPLLVPLQYPAGNIPVFQLCNEIGCINWVGKLPDYSPEAEALYRKFVLNLYGSLKKVNTVYHSTYTSEKQLVQPDKNCERKNFRKWLDWSDFYAFYFSEYYSKLAAAARKHGVKTHLIANIPQFYDFDVRGRGIYSPLTTLNFRKFPEKNPDVIFGGAYQMRRLDYENFHDILLTSEHVKSITPDKSPAICAELQSGVLADKPKLYPPDIELNLKTSLISGLNAVNCYMFAGGENFRIAGQFGKYHEWQAPVASDGELRSHYHPMQRFGKLISLYGSEIAECSKCNDLTIGFCDDYYKTAYLEGSFSEELYSLRNRFYFDGLARLLSLAGYSYSVISLSDSIPDTIKTLAISSFSFMTEKMQNNLLNFVENGGNLLITGTLNLTDENGNPAPVFLDKLGIRAATMPQVRTIMFGDKELFTDLQPVDLFENLPVKAKIIARYQDRICGFETPYGKGRIIALGFNLHDKFQYFTDVMEILSGMAGVTKTVCSPERNLITVLRCNGKKGFLFAGNFHEENHQQKVRFQIGKETFCLEIDLLQRSGVILPVNQSLDGGAVLKYSTAEVLEISQKGKKLLISGYSPVKSGFELLLSGISIRKASCRQGKVSFSVSDGNTTVRVAQKPGFSQFTLSIITD